MNDNLPSQLEYKKYKYKLTPFKLCVLQNFPFIEADFDAITNYQLLCKVVEYLNHVIDNQNTVEDNFKIMTDNLNTLYNFLDTLDLQDEVNNKLDEMAEDGTLKDILDELLVYEKLGKEDNQQMYELSLKRIMRTLERNANHPEHVAGEDYAIMQGGTYTGNNKIIVARIRNNIQNDTLLQEISLDTGLVIREKKLPLAHANSITYNPETNKLYVTSLLLNIEDVNTQLKELYVINYNDLSLDTTITFTSLTEGEGVHSVSYDIETNKYYLATEDALHNNKITLYEMNINNYELTKIELPDDTGLLSTTNNNDILVYDNTFYLLKYSPQVIITYDLETLKLRNIYNINNVTEVGNTVGELENLSIKYDTELKNLVIGTNHIECTNGFYHMFQYFECNPVYNIENLTPRNQNDLSRTLFVDINSTAINPTGTQNNSFKHISEALELAQVIKGGLRIYLSAGEYPYTNINITNENIIILGDANTKENYIIDGMLIDRCNSIYLTGLTINNKSTTQEYDLFIEYSKVKLSVIDMLSNINCHIYARGCTVEFTYINHNNYLFYCQTEPNLICYDRFPNYKILNQIPNINKPIGILAYKPITSSLSTYSMEGYEPLILNEHNRLSLYVSGNYNMAVTETYSRNNTGNRNVTVILGDIIVQIWIDFDTANNLIGLKIQKAWKISTTGITDVTNTTTINVSLFFKGLEWVNNT